MIYQPYKVLRGTKTERSAVSGPGDGLLSVFPSTFSSWVGAVDAAKCANEAYRVGYAHAQADMRKALGIGEQP